MPDVDAVTFDYWNTLVWEEAGHLAGRRTEAWAGLLEEAGFAMERSLLDGHLLEAAADLRCAEAAMASERANCRQLARPRPARDGLGVHPEQLRHLGRGEQRFWAVELVGLGHGSLRCRALLRCESKLAGCQPVRFLP